MNNIIGLWLVHDAPVDVGADNVTCGVKVPPPAKYDFLCYLESHDPTSIDSIIIVVLNISDLLESYPS